MNKLAAAQKEYVTANVLFEDAQRRFYEAEAQFLKAHNLPAFEEMTDDEFSAFWDDNNPLKTELVLLPVTFEEQSARHRVNAAAKNLAEIGLQIMPDGDEKQSLTDGVATSIVWQEKVAKIALKLDPNDPLVIDKIGKQ